MKIWKMLLCLAVMALLLGVAVASAEIASGTSGTCKWVIDDNGVLTISPKEGNSGTLGTWSSFNAPWCAQRYREQIKGAQFVGTVQAKSCNAMFCYLRKIESVNLTGLVTTGVEDFSSMFRECNSLQTLDVSGLDTSSATTMQFMFSGCTVLQTLDVSNIKTSKVENMNCMFTGCKELTELKVSMWDVSSVESMYQMFASCSGLSKLDVSNWDVSSVEDMKQMFENCSNLQKLDVSKWNTSSSTSMMEMFKNCSNLQTLDVSGWNLSNVTEISYMFYNCSNLQELDVSRWNVSGVRNIVDTFYNCSSLQKLDVSRWNVSKVLNMGSAFSCCSGLQELDLSGWNTANVTSMINIFFKDNTLKKIIVGKDFINPTRANVFAKFPVKMYEINHEDDTRRYRYNQDSRIPSSTGDGAAVNGGTNIYVVGNIVSFNENGGTGTMDDQPFFYSLNAKNLSDNSFTYAGKVFTGWNTKANGTGTAYAASDLLSYESFSGDITLYAQWAPAAKITFDLAGGTLDGKTGSIVLTVPKGTDITILNAPEKEGFEFQYWEGSAYYPGQTYTANEDHTFTAKWGPKPTVPPVVPKTGDTARPALYLAFAALSALALLALGWKRRAEK